MAAALGLALSLVACSPALNWRESRLDPHGAVVLFPCKPQARERAILFDGVSARMTMLSCEADGATYVLASADLGDPARTAAALAQWQTSTADNIGAAPVIVGPAKMKGAATSERSVILSLQGKSPDGSALFEQAAFFVKGAKIYEAAVVSRTLQPEASVVFFDGIKLE